MGNVVEFAVDHWASEFNYVGCALLEINDVLGSRIKARQLLFNVSVVTTSGYPCMQQRDLCARYFFDVVVKLCTCLNAWE